MTKVVNIIGILPSEITNNISGVDIGSVKQFTGIDVNIVPDETVLLLQEFDNLDGWTVTQGTSPTPSGGVPANADWTLRDNGYTYEAVPVTFTSPHSKFCLANPKSQGGTGDSHVILQSPSINTIGCETLVMSFKHYYRRTTTGFVSDFIYVEYSFDNSNWITFFTSGTTGSPSSFIDTGFLNISECVNQSTVYFRFRYRSSNPGASFYWAIGEIKVQTKSDLDIEKPVITQFAMPAIANAGQTFYRSILVATDNVAVVSHYISSNNSNRPTKYGGTWYLLNNPSGFNYGAGTYTFYAWVKDDAGNISDVATSTTVVT